MSELQAHQFTGKFDVVGAAGPIATFAGTKPAALAHGYLFSGPEGAGKKTFARRFAQSLLCATPKSTVLGYCGVCNPCTLVEAGTHPDLVERGGEIKIGDRDAGGSRDGAELTARDLVRQLALHAYGGGYRVVVLGDVAFADHRSANALLKFFEEPPPRVVLILTTSMPGRLIETIRSRLIDIVFTAFSDAEVTDILVRGQVSPEDAERAARIAQGDAALAKILVDESSASVRGDASEWFFESVRGGVPDPAWVNRQTLEEGLAVIRSLVRDWAVRSVVRNDAKYLAGDQKARLDVLEPDPQRAVKSLEAVAEAQRLARTNVSPALVLQLLQMKMAS